MTQLISTHEQSTHEQIEEVLHKYGQGVHNGDGAVLKEAFHPQATIAGYYEGHLILHIRDDFIKVIESMPIPATQGEPYEKETTSVELAGNAAMARMREQYQGLTFTNYFTLLQVDGHWSIINKTFSHEPRS
jgi:hypothetical protein